MQGRRSVQEDRHVIIEDFSSFIATATQRGEFQLPLTLQPAVLLGLFDGHMGSQASSFCAKHLPVEIAKELADLSLHFFSNSSNETPTFKSASSQVNSARESGDGRSDGTHEGSPLRVKPFRKPEDHEPARVDSKDAGFENISKRRRLLTASTETEDATTVTCLESSTNSDGEASDRKGAATVSSRSHDSAVMDPSENNGNSTLLSSGPADRRSDVPPSAQEPGLRVAAVASAISRAFANTDQQFLQKHRLNKDGTTVSLVLLLGKHMFTAWLGDSRMVLGSLRRIHFSEAGMAPLVNVSATPGCPVPSLSVGVPAVELPSKNDDLASHASTGVQWITSPLSCDHKPSRADERTRIVSAGGQVLNIDGISRVARGDFQAECRRLKQLNCFNYGGASSRQTPVALAVSRSMGDRELKVDVKVPLVISMPEMRYLQLSPEDDKVVILGCDGIWDVLTDQEVVSLLERHTTGEAYDATQFEAGASAAVKLAFQRGSQDNLTIVFARITAPTTRSPVPQHH